jgi:hypothetical protein
MLFCGLQIIPRLEDMLKAVRMAKRRAVSADTGAAQPLV